jgi:hypothetical protein
MSARLDTSVLNVNVGELLVSKHREANFNCSVLLVRCFAFLYFFKPDIWAVLCKWSSDPTCAKLFPESCPSLNSAA